MCTAMDSKPLVLMICVVFGPVFAAEEVCPEMAALTCFRAFHLRLIPVAVLFNAGEEPPDE